MNSVIRHISGQHKGQQVGPPVFDYNLGTREAPRLRRGATAGIVRKIELVEGPTDDALFRRSEEIRKEKLNRLRKEHADWLGGEEALLEAVAKYPSWQPREHPYGRVGPPDAQLTAPLQADTHPAATRTDPVPARKWSDSTLR